MSNPWADPATPTQPGEPYAGPPGTTPPPSYGSPYGPPVYGQPAYGPPTYGAPQYGPPPYAGYPPAYGYPAPWAPPRRPGQLITAAVLAFVQGGLVLIASLYVWFFASVADLALQGTSGSFAPGPVDALATEGTTLAIVQILSFVLLVVGGIRALNARTQGAWRLLLVSHAVQVALAVYWAVRLSMIFDDVPGPDGEGPLVAFTVFFAAGPLVAIGLLLTRTVRAWFAPAGQTSVPPQL
jgi:hypothetical protein